MILLYWKFCVYKIDGHVCPVFCCSDDSDPMTCIPSTTRDFSSCTSLSSNGRLFMRPRGAWRVKMMRERRVLFAVWVQGLGFQLCSCPTRAATQPQSVEWWGPCPHQHTTATPREGPRPGHRKRTRHHAPSLWRAQTARSLESHMYKPGLNDARTDASLSLPRFVSRLIRTNFCVSSSCLVHYGLRSCGSLVVRNYVAQLLPADCRGFISMRVRGRRLCRRHDLFQTVNALDGTCSSNNWRCRGHEPLLPKVPLATVRNTYLWRSLGVGDHQLRRLSCNENHALPLSFFQWYNSLRRRCGGAQGVGRGYGCRCNEGGDVRGPGGGLLRTVWCLSRLTTSGSTTDKRDATWRTRSFALIEPNPSACSERRTLDIDNDNDNDNDTLSEGPPTWTVRYLALRTWVTGSWPKKKALLSFCFLALLARGK